MGEGAFFHPDGLPIGITCVTKENQQRPWLLFETGAVARNISDANVTPFLIDIDPPALIQPLNEFQHTVANETDTFQMVASINKLIPTPLPESLLKSSFDAHWPKLQRAIETIPKLPGPATPPRPDRHLLEEALLRLRRLEGSVVTSSLDDMRKIMQRPELRSAFAGSETLALAKRLDELGRDEDANAVDDWFVEHAERSEYDGRWDSRWSGAAAGDGWKTGFAEVFLVDDRFYALYIEPGSEHMVMAQRLDGDKLFGRYYNLNMTGETTAWVGRFVSKDRIDGLWPEGRWDFRRRPVNSFSK